MNKAQIAEKLISYLKKQYPTKSIDEETGLYDLGIEDDDMFTFAFDVAGHFDLDGWIDGDELEINMSVWHVIDFIDEII